MKFSKKNVLLEKHLLLAIEKTINFNQNIELRDCNEIFKIKKIITDIENANSKKTQEKLENIISNIKNKIKALYNNEEIELKSYYKPKKLNYEDYRELKIHNNLVDEIALNAITLIFIDSLRTLISNNSNCGNILDTFESKNFFLPYFLQYKKFIGKRFEYINNNRFNYLSVFDIKKFYDRINFDKIKEILLEHFDNNNSDVMETIGIYEKLCANGLPQGPVFSHFFATLILYDLRDKFLEKFPTFEIIYYVDDINVFFNSIDSDESNKIDEKIKNFLIEYLKPKFIENNELEILNIEKHQIIPIAERDNISNIILQLSAIDEFRKDDSKKMDSFERETLSSDLEKLFEEMIEIFQKAPKNKVESSIFSENINIIEKTNRFRTYRQLLLANDKNELKRKVSEFIENDIKRSENKVSKNDDAKLGSFFDKSFENYIRAIVSVLDDFGESPKKTKNYLLFNVIKKVDEVFKTFEYKEEYKKTFRKICDNIVIQYKNYKIIKKMRNSRIIINSYVGTYKIEEVHENLIKIKEKILKNCHNEYEDDEKIYTDIFLKINIKKQKIDDKKQKIDDEERKIYDKKLVLKAIRIKGKSIFREESLLEQLNMYFFLLFKCEFSEKNKFPIYNKNNELLKVYEYRILNLYNGYSLCLFDSIDKTINILDEAISENSSETCDSLIHNTIDIISKKIKNRQMIDSIIVAHHFVRDVWKNGARDLPFYTLHNHEHSVELVKILDKVNSRSNGIIINYLTNYEYYVLIMAIYFHDLGMLFFNYDNLRKADYDKEAREFEIKQFSFYTNDLANFKIRYNRNEKIEKIIQSYKNHRDYRSKWTRGNHHYNTSRFNEIDNIAIDSLGALIKNACFNHGVKKSEMRLIDEYRDNVKIEAYKISIYLRFLDGLDNCKNRVSKSHYNTLKNYVQKDDIEELTITHWAKHLLIDKIDYKMKSIEDYKNCTGEKFLSNVKKELNICLSINEKMDTTSQKSSEKMGYLKIVEEKNKADSGYILIEDKEQPRKTMFDYFINKYFYWTCKGIKDMSELLEKSYGIALTFSYELGKRKKKNSEIIYKYLQEN